MNETRLNRDRNKVSITLPLVLLVLAGILAFGVLSPGGGPAPGQPAPEISGRIEDGSTVRLSDFRKKVVFLDFWGDW